MKILTIILSGIAGIIGLLLIVALFVPNEYSIEREVTIGTSKNRVFDYVKYLKNQDNFSKWTMADPAMKKGFRGTDGTVGFVYSWDGNDQVGKGEQEIKSIKEGERIDMELRFVKPFEGNAEAYFTTELTENNTTKVKWGMQGKSKYPMNIMNLITNGILGRDMETSLRRLKNVLEK